MERGKLAKAQECLQYAHQLAPNEDYILRHLQIVQTRILKLKQAAGHHKEKEIAFAEFDPTDFGGGGYIKSTAVNIDNVKNNIPAPIVSDVPDGKKETRKSVSKQEKPQTPKKVDPQNQQQSIVGDPIFMEADAVTSKIQDEFRLSNSGQNSINRQRYHHHHQQHNHRLQSHVPHRQGQSIFSNDNDDPSSGMS